LEGIDLSIDKEEYIYICGANGSGKSTLGYLFNGLIPHFFGGTLKGSVFVRGINTRERRVSDFLSHVGLVFQNADAQLFSNTVEEEILFGLENLGLPPQEMDARIKEISEVIHIEDLLDRTPMSLSGGEKRLVAIASILCLNPSMLLLDEPYANLDWEGIHRVSRVLKDIHMKGKSVVVIEQRASGTMSDTTRCIVMEEGKILFDGAPEEAHDLLVEVKLIPQYKKRNQPKDNGMAPLLVAQDITYHVGEKKILRGISFELKVGEAVAIVGKNGSGKTTLIKHFNGLLRPTDGKVFFQGEKVREKVPSEMAVELGLSFQNPNDQFFKNNVGEELLAAPKALGKKKKSWIVEVCDIFDLHSLLDRSPFRLSEGEKKRVAVSSILVMAPKLLILDEPTIGQDGRFREILAQVLSDLEDRGFTIIIVTHDLDFAKATTDRWIVMLDGRVVGDGRPDELLNDKQLKRTGALGRVDMD
jgi:energy-coupling factor transport system ATP-binding protein